MTSYIAAIRAEWVAAEWVFCPWTRTLRLPVKEVTFGETIDAYIDADSSQDKG